MDKRVQRRFALAVVANLEDTVTITQHLLRTDFEPKHLSIIGQEASFAGERHNAADLAQIMTQSPVTPKLLVDSNRIVALARDCSSLPRTIADNAEDLGKVLLQWVSREHAERLLDAVYRGEFLLLVELHSMVEERIVTRILEQKCHGRSACIKSTLARSIYRCDHGKADVIRKKSFFPQR